MTPLPSTPSRETATGANPLYVTNWNWTLADMDRIEAMVQRRATASEIADKFGVTAAEIQKLCARNGLAVHLGRRTA